MHVEPRPEHDWLRRLVGHWHYEGACAGEPGAAALSFGGVETVRAVGDIWIVAEGQGEMPGGGSSITLLTLGYDVRQRQFVGSWVGSMMAHLWVYHAGSLDAAGRVLTLEAEGPDLTGAADGTSRYRDVVELVGDAERRFRGLVATADGQWRELMSSTYRRAD